MTREEETKIIEEFGNVKQEKLDERSYKGRLGWRTKSIKKLFYLAVKEMIELFFAIFFGIGDIKKESADVSNSVMFIWDKELTDSRNKGKVKTI